jgi:hypothetical protein
MAAPPTAPTPTATEVPATATPFPTPTATATPAGPTNTPLPTATLITDINSEAVIWADANTNCRLGPSQAYKVDGYLLLNVESTVHGRDDDENWWYIANPTKDDKYCWVWTKTTNVEGEKAPNDCYWKYVSECCKQDINKFCKEYCWPEWCKENWRYIEDCQPICCKW